MKLFTDENGNLYIVNDQNKVVDSVKTAFKSDITDNIGVNYGVYAETCGGYANQIHTAAYLSYDEEQVYYATNLESYEEGCGEDDCSCAMCTEWTMIEYMDNVGDLTKLYWIDEDTAIEKADGKLRQKLIEKKFERYDIAV